MNELVQALRHLVIANRILSHEGVVDGYGHISVRHPTNPDRFLLSRSLSPDNVTIDDILEFELDGTPVDPKGPAPYLERFIHGAVFEARPEVQSVIHAHTEELIPFGVTGVPLRPLIHVASRIGTEVPVWDIADRFGDGTNLLVVNIDQGRDLARTLDKNALVLMRGHGCTIAAESTHAATLTAIYARSNARLQMQAMAMGTVKYLAPGEVAARPEIDPNIQRRLPVDRTWQYYRHRAGCEDI